MTVPFRVVISRGSPETNARSCTPLLDPCGRLHSPRRSRCPNVAPSARLDHGIASRALGAGDSNRFSMATDAPNLDALETAEEVVRAVEESGAKAVAVQADVSSEADVQAMFAKAVETFGTADILINNAGLQKDASFVDMTLDEWNLVISVNLTGQFLCAREAVANSVAAGLDPRFASRSARSFAGLRYTKWSHGRGT